MHKNIGCDALDILGYSGIFWDMCNRRPVCCYTRIAIMADDDEEVIKVCLNPDCTGKNPMKGDWCTACAGEEREPSLESQARARG